MNIADMTEPEATDKTALTIRSNLAQVESALTELDKISAGLSDLAARYPVDLVYDVTTTKGMAEAVAHRAAWRDPRILVEKYRKTAKAPVLALGKDIDTRASWITEQLLIGETPVDKQIKAEEARKEAEKQARINAEAGRALAIQEAIADLHMEVLAVASKPSAQIAAALDELSARVLDPLVFQEQIAQAEAARRAAVEKLKTALSAMKFNEAEAAKAAADRAELEQLRKAQADQKAKDEAAAAQARKAAAALAKQQREAAEKLAREQAELDRQKAEFAEAQRKAAEPPPVPAEPVAAVVAPPAPVQAPAAPILPAAVTNAPRLDARESLQALADYFRRIESLWEGPDGCGTYGTGLCVKIAGTLDVLAVEPMALGLTRIPLFPAQATTQGET